MGVGALILWKKGHLDKELPRYQFQRKRWKKAGYSNDAFSIQELIKMTLIIIGMKTYQILEIDF